MGNSLVTCKHTDDIDSYIDINNSCALTHTPSQSEPRATGRPVRSNPSSQADDRVIPDGYIDDQYTLLMHAQCF